MTKKHEKHQKQKGWTSNYKDLWQYDIIHDKKARKVPKARGGGVIECGQKRSSDKKAPKARGVGVIECGQNCTSNKKHEKQEGVV